MKEKWYPCSVETYRYALHATFFVFCLIVFLSFLDRVWVVAEGARRKDGELERCLLFVPSFALGFCVERGVSRRQERRSSYVSTWLCERIVVRRHARRGTEEV